MQKRVFLALLFLISQLSFSQNIEHSIDSIIHTKFDSSDTPGGVFLVAVKGKPFYKKAFGLANLELGTKMTTDHVFQIGSMTKQFTAIAILQLEEQGKLSVNDPVSKFIPTYPNGEHITVSHLLSHTSGIKNFTQMRNIFTIAQKNMSSKELIDFFKDEPIDFQPNEQFKYNNSGYVILGHIIEHITGITYEEYIQQHIFDPIGMKNSYYANDRKIIKNRAYGYHKKKDGYVNKTVINFSIPFSSGALMSSLEDMLKWQNALHKNLLLSKEHTTKAFTQKPLKNGELISYGYGWHVKKTREVTTLEHGGSIFGFKSMGVYIPEKEIYILELSNCDCNSPTKIIKDIATLVEKTF